MLAPGELPTRALLGTYLERCCVHACIQQCTHEYTSVYTRVYFSLLSSSYVPDKYMSRVQVFLSSVYASRLSSPCPLVIACVSSWGEAGEIFVRYLFLRSRINKFAVESS